jgi:hypothetical protein
LEQGASLTLTLTPLADVAPRVPLLWLLGAHRPPVSIRLIRVADADTDPACRRRSARAAAGAAGVLTVTKSVCADVHDTHRPPVSIRLSGICTAGCQSAAVGARRVDDTDTDPACRRRSARAAVGAAGVLTETPSVCSDVNDTHRPPVSIRL